MNTALPRRARTNLVTNSRWAAYATAGAATALGAASSAEAAIHYSGVLNVPITGAPTIQTFALSNANNYFVVAHSAFASGFAGFVDKGAVSAMFRGLSNGPFRYPSRLGSGINVSAPGNFVANNGSFFATLASNQYAGGQWLAAGTGFVGMKFNTGAGIEYGWARLNMDGTANGNTFTLVDYAWADPGTPILTGQTSAVPEPGSLALLAIGAAGLVAWRRQRAQG